MKNDEFYLKKIAENTKTIKEVCIGIFIILSCVVLILPLFLS